MNQLASDISVLIPFYNREQYIDQAIQSVLAQTLKPLEIIVINDCSRESSRRFLDRYASVCKIVDLKKNVGLAGSRNAGIHVARGQFIALLDDDDVWLPGKLEMQRRYMEDHPECSLIHSAVWAFFSDKPDEIWKRFDPGPMTLAQALTDEHWVVPSTLMIRTDVMRALGGFDTSFRENEDRDFMIRCAAAGYKIEGINEPLIRLRRTGHDSLSEHRWRMFRIHIKIVWIHKALYYRAYGVRGPMNFLLRTLFLASSKTRYVDGLVRFVLRVIEVKWIVKFGYRDPVLSENQRQPMKVQSAVLQMPSTGDN